MPLFYNTSAPSHGDANSITNTATNLGLRDFLLHRNIQNPIKYPQLSTSVNGSPRGGEPFLDLSQGSDAVIPQTSIEIQGIGFYEDNVSSNFFKDTDVTSAGVLISIDNVTRTSIYPEPLAGTINYKEEDLTQYGLLAKSDYKKFRQGNTSKNLYFDSAKQIDMADLVSIQPLGINQQLGSYADEYGRLNIGNTNATQAADIIGSVLNGQGVGFSNSGVVPNFDIRASLAGRVLTATGNLSDTKLGVIGGQQLALNMANNAAFNTEKTLLGALNINDNILSLVKGKGLAGLRDDYTITIPNGNFGQTVLNYFEKVTGFYVPRSFMTPDASIFQSESGNIDNITRASSLLLNTGKGQRNQLKFNINSSLIGTGNYDNPNNTFFRSGYGANYQYNGESIGIQNPKLYFLDDGNGGIKNVLNPLSDTEVVPEINYNYSNMVVSAGFNDPNDPSYLGGLNNPNFIKNNSSAFAVKFAWGSEIGGYTNSTSNAIDFVSPNQTNLIGKTQRLFRSKAMKTIISNKGDTTGVGINQSQIQTSVIKGSDGSYAISKGSAVLTSNKFNTNGSIIQGPISGNTADNLFCRSFTSYYRYDQVQKLIRHRGLNQSENNASPIMNRYWRQNYEGSVLDDNGFPKIAPYDDDDLSRASDNPKKYMFSIENLAWVGHPALNLLDEEQGPGDLLTGKFGRIMWFPPYDLSFNESSNVQWESNLFIGRGEPLYTYNNTERAGTLSFKVIVDHSSIMNSFRKDFSPDITEEFVRSWLAGCTDLNDLQWADKLTVLERNTPSKNPQQPQQQTITSNINIPSFNIYFANDRADFVNGYETSFSGVPGGYQGDLKYEPSHKTPRSFNDNQGYGLNTLPITFNGKTYNGWVDPNFLPDLKSYLTGDDFLNIDGSTNYQITLNGYASSQGDAQINQQLSKDRAFTIQKWLSSDDKIPITSIVIGEGGQVYNSTGNNPYIASTPEDQLGPKSDRFVKVTFESNNNNIAAQNPAPQALPNTSNAQLNETIKQRFYSEAFFFKKLKETDSFVFDQLSEKIKYFHPAFHSITPEGLNSRLTFLLQCTRQGPTIPSATANNLAFGPPPVCILRIGDFYNTKIIIDNVTFDFQEPQWDLNPEGIGIQPMIANVTMSFKYIGGSSLLGPINKLQNALSFNFFANTQVYDRRSDYVAKASTINAASGTNQFPDKRATYLDTDLENNYVLQNGWDITTKSMDEDNTFSPNTLVNQTDVNQTKAASKQTKQEQTTSVNSSFDNSVLYIPVESVYSGTTSNGNAALNFVIENNSPTEEITQRYNFVTVTISNISDASINFVYDASKYVESSELFINTNLNKASFTFDLGLFTSTSNVDIYSVFSNVGKYILKVKMIGIEDNSSITLKSNFYGS
jgi:hypothetical protein